MNGQFALHGKVAVVTGALGLLGREHCRVLAEAGAYVVAADLDRAPLTDFASALSINGPRALAVELDVTSVESVERLRYEVMAEFGRVDVLVNNAAMDDKFEPGRDLEASRFERYSVERFRRQLDVNVTGPFLTCQALAPAMAEAGSGSIVNIASTYGLVAPDQKLYVRPDGSQAFFKGPAYPASKGALLQLTRYLAAYYGRRGVRVNALSPGGVDASQEDWFRTAYALRTQLGRMATRSDYRGALLFLASEASAYMTGANLVVDGGFTTC